MKKTIILATLLSSQFTQADVFLGGDVEINYFDNKTIVDDVEAHSEASLFGSLSFEHMIPLVPNVRFSFGNADSDLISYGKNDITAYYEIFDNDLLSFDIGVGATQIHSGEVLMTYNQDVSSTTVEFEGVIPHAYVGLELGIPSTPLTLYSDLLATAYKDSKLIDGSVGIRYDVSLALVEVGVQAGYKVLEFNMDDFDSLNYNVKNDGWFLGVNFDF